MRNLVLCAVTLLPMVAAAFFAPGAQAADGVIAIPSGYSVEVTIDRLVAALKANGNTVFARIDHAEGAKAAGLTMKPAQVLIFGNPKVGTPIMLAGPTAAIDLPMKALAYEDAGGKVWLAYNDPAWIARRHGIDPAAVPAVGALSQALATLMAKIAAKP